MYIKTTVSITLLTNVLWIKLFLQYYWMYDKYTDMQESMLGSIKSKDNTSSKDIISQYFTKKIWHISKRDKRYAGHHKAQGYR